MTYPLFVDQEPIQVLDKKAHSRGDPDSEHLVKIAALDKTLEQEFAGRLAVNPALSRQLVSFQASKERPIARWYKFKEAYSDSLVEYLFAANAVNEGPILDPFAGSGTTLFASAAMGLASDGIELLPIGQEVIAARQLLQGEHASECLDAIERWRIERPWLQEHAVEQLPEVKITRGAYPPGTKSAIERYIAALRHEQPPARRVLRFALLCVLESVSYTRKDGQYLRWDSRSGRQGGKKPFHKGPIAEFNLAIIDKLSQISSDAQADTLMPRHARQPGEVNVYAGSCLEVLPGLAANHYSAVMTSPPYCNRYDYTRTYALELALLGATEQQFVELRQNMLSCTVENKAKDLIAMNPHWERAVRVADHTALLQEIIAYLEHEKELGALNNMGIPRMVRGYFYEMACVIAECQRVLRPGAVMFMVNDNVRYAGASVSVDLILSRFAEQLGFTVSHIYVLPNGKGNSSQQMGVHGRDELRKSVYVWRKDL
ncbi:MAG: site-specific DNA-methyltransferase [Chloroflexi bacterium]|nr:site-specific DNA-methyltransferase [Chloroflexota bacterium]